MRHMKTISKVKIKQGKWCTELIGYIRIKK